MHTPRNPFWSIVFSLFFLLLVGVGISYLISTDAFIRNLSAGDFILMVLAVWRLTRLFTYDAITQFVRDWFVNAPPDSFGGSFHTLMTCPWCTGLWFGATVVFFYFATPFAWPVILMLAIAAVASFFQVLSNLIGWNAEYKKVQTLRLKESWSPHHGEDKNTC
jgi:uncharacterized membrane protein